VCFNHEWILWMFNQAGEIQNSLYKTAPANEERWLNFMDSDSKYSFEFFRHLHKGAKTSAEQIVPQIMQLLSPTSVVDVGCGAGTWLSVFLSAGVEDVLGLDGNHVPRELLQIPAEKFVPLDLTKPVDVNRKFDLVLSLEVAEHLPSEAADIFVESLVRMGDVIVFSAAIPLQGGDGHVNEQWLDYWVARFNKKGFAASGCIRDRIWANQEVEWWYAQNIMVLYKPAALDLCPGLKKAISSTPDSCESVIHPRHYEQVKWNYMVLEAALDVVDSVPVGESFVFFDNDQTNYKFEPARRALKIPTDKKWYWMFPPADEAAIEELERVTSDGVKYIVIAWPAYWWLAERQKLKKHLHSNYSLLLENKRVMVFKS